MREKTPLNQRFSSDGSGSKGSNVDVDVRAATFLDVSVLRCLLVAQWQEEGIFWALQYLLNRYNKCFF